MQTSFTTSDIKAGDIVTIREWGGDRFSEATVTRVLEDIKNGRPGIEAATIRNGVESGTADRWAYLDQVVSVDHRDN